MRLARRIFQYGKWQLIDWMFRRVSLFCVEVDAPSVGFFAQVGSLLPLLLHCEARGLKPSIVLSSRSYTDASRGPNFLDYYFEGPAYTDLQRRFLRTLPVRKVRAFTDLRVWSRERYPGLQTSGKFFRKYYRLRPEMLSESEAFARENFVPGRTLGVHYRGTDKETEASPISFEDTLRYVRRCLRRHPALDTVFVATDTADYIRFVRRELADLRVVVREEIRSADHQPVHLSGGDPYQNGRDALLNCLLLSRCDVLLKTMSNLSGWAKVFNPALRVYLMNRPAKSGIKWLGFPEREMVEKNWYAPVSDQSKDLPE